MPRPRPLTSVEARRSLAHRLSPLADRLRQFSTRFGLRSRRVFLVWTKYTGAERGEGREQEVARLELLPTPKVSELTSVTFQPYAAGLLPVGSIRVENISARLSNETLSGQVPPYTERAGGSVQEPYDFFYEVVEDQRVSAAPERAKYRLIGTPTRVEGNVSWSVLLERISEDRAPSGQSRYLADE